MVTGWKTATVKETSTIFGRIGFRGYTKEDIVDAYEGAISLSPSNLKDGKVDITNSTFISWDKYNESPEIKLQDGDVVLVKTGSTYGKSAYVDNLKWAATLNPQIVVFKNVRINKKLFAYFVQAPEFQKQIEATIVGGAIPTLSQNQVYQFEITFPIDVGEQNRIAEALSDVDSMISSLEKLIAKKKAIKQGAMQELLTGKKRLPGFDGDIKYKSLASLCTVFADGDWIESKDQSNDGIRLIQAGNIGVGKYLDKTDKQRFISMDTFDRLKCLEIFENDVIVSRLPEPAGRACILPYSNKRRITAVDCTIIRFADYNPILFVAYSQTKQYQDKVDMAMAGSTRQRISRKELGEIPIPVFPTIEEQNALASIFSDMDNEIETLEQKLAKARQIKQGMMQQLLTGKIRLVLESADNKPIEAVSKPHHNHQFDDAVMIAAIVNEFYNDTIPLGRKKVQKLLYLLRRKQEADTSAFKKKAAGPYADEVRYKGGEPIAIRSQYVLKRQGTKGTTFSKGEKIESALEYIKKWEMTEDIKWLASTFKYTKTTDLELFATIDMAMCDLEEEGVEVSVDSIKNLIASNKEWKEKLLKTYFSDKDIARAIMICKKVLQK